MSKSPNQILFLVLSIVMVLFFSVAFCEAAPPRYVTVAAIQQPKWSEGDSAEAVRDWQLKWVMEHLEIAAKAKADIACLPEGSVKIPGASIPGCPEVDAVRKIARKHKMYIIFPVIAAREGVKHNTAIIIGRDGAIAGYYDKVHPTQTEKNRGVVPGDDFPVFELDFGKIGVMICHDLSFPESARALMLKGAELVFWPTWWSGWGQELDWIVIRSRAIDNDLYLVNVSRGVKPGEGWRPRDPIGRSGVIDPYGQTLSNAGYESGVVIEKIDLNRKRIAPSFSSGAVGESFRESVLQDRKPAAYKILSSTE